VKILTKSYSLKKEIEQTDKLIDERVCTLYDVKEIDKNIIEDNQEVHHAKKH